MSLRSKALAVGALALAVIASPVTAQVQANSAEGALIIEGREGAGFGGLLPVLLAVGQTVNYEVSGLPGAPFAVLQGPSLEPGVPFGGGLVNIAIAQSTVLLNGFDPAFAAVFNTGSGTFSVAGTWPAFPIGTTMTLQGVVMGSLGLVNTAPATLLTVPGDPIPATLNLQQTVLDFDAGNRHAVLADLNGDLNLDVVASSFIWIGDGAFGFAPAGIDPPGVEVAVAQLVGDENPDLLTFDDIFGGVVIYEGDGSGAFNNPPAVQFVPTVNSNDNGDAAVADLDGNGFLDVVIADSIAPSGLAIQFNLGGGTFIHAPINSVTSSRTVAVADFDGDQNLDIVADVVPFSQTTAETVIFWGNTGSNYTLANSTSIGGLPRGGSFWLRARDMNGDGSPDILWSGVSEQGVLLNNGTGQFSFSPIPVAPATCCLAPQMESADVDNDGDQDVVFVNKTNGSWLVIASNDGAGGFTTTWFIPVAGDPIAANGPGFVLPGDFDGDGDADLFIGGSPATIIRNLN